MLSDEFSKKIVIGLTGGFHRLEKLSGTLVDGYCGLGICERHRQL